MANVVREKNDYGPFATIADANVAEAWDVMTSDHWYAARKTVEEALAECRGLAGRQFTPTAVGALEALDRRGELTPAATRLHRPTDVGAVGDA